MRCYFLVIVTLAKKPNSFSAIATDRQHNQACPTGVHPTKDLRPATAPSHYLFSLLSYQNLRKTPMIQLKSGKVIVDQLSKVKRKI